MANSTDERVSEIESKVMFQEDTLQALSDALSDQQARVEALESTLTLLVQTLESEPDGDVEEPPPPHY